MKILEFTDVHCTSSAEFSKPTSDGLTEYLQLFIKSFEFVTQVALDHKPDLVVFGGDLWDAQDYIDTMSVNVAHRVFEKLTKLVNSEFLAIVGNHDYYSIEHSIHTLEFLRGLGWSVADEVSCLRYGDCKVLAMPYRDQYDLTELDQIVTSFHPDVAFTHLDVFGGMRRSPVSAHDKKAYSDHGLPPSALSSAGVVLNGHYHHPSQVTSNWYNIGSLTSRTFHDKNSDPRGCVIYDTELKQLTRFVNPNARSFIDLHLDSSSDFDELVTRDLSTTYARIYYELDVEDQAISLRELFAGARLLPQASESQQVVESTVDVRLSLEENLQKYIKHEYEDPRLEGVAAEIFKQASEEYADSSSREPLDFGWLVITNFLSIRSLRINLRGRGLLLVRGLNLDDAGQDSNGSGKSSLIHAIYWALKGKLLDKKCKANEVIHWDADFCRVELEVYSGGKLHTVVRTRRDPELKNGVYLLAGGVDAGARLARDTGRRIEEILGRSEETLQHTCFLANDLSSRFTDLSESDASRLLEEIIDSKPYHLCKALAKKELDKKEITYYKVKGSLASALKYKENMEESITKLEKEIENFDRNTSEELTLRQLRKEKLRIEEASYASKIVVDEAELQELHRVIDSIKPKYDAFLASKNSLASTLAGIDTDLAVIGVEIQRLRTIHGKGACPQCLRELDCVSITQDLKSTQERQAAVINSRSPIIDEMIRLDDRLKAFDTKISSSYETISRKTSSIAESRRKLEELRSELTKEDDAVTAVARDRSVLETQLRIRRDDLENVKKAVEDCISEEKKAEDELSIYRTLVDDVFDELGVRKMILTQVALPYINKSLPYYVNRVWPGQSVELLPDMTLQLSGKMSFHMTSRGQRRRLDWVMQLVLADLASATGHSTINLLSVDECLDSLDRSGCKAAVDILKDKSEGRTVLLVTHSDFISTLIPHQVHLTRKEGSTSMEEVQLREVMP